MPRSATAEVARDFARIVDAEQLIESWVGVVVERRERISCGMGATHLDGVGARSSGEHQDTECGHH